MTVSFRWTEGRFRHSIVLNDSNGTTLDHWEDAIESASDEWPASPPIQQLSLESIQERPTLLGVGQAGKSHWSISVEPIAAPDARGLRFDLACRSRTLPHWLGSTYKRLFDGGPSPRQLVIQSENGQVSQSDSRVIACDLGQGAETKYPLTFRWSYLLVASD
jgi:hypothetical protein